MNEEIYSFSITKILQQLASILVGGVFGIAFAQAALSQALQDELVPEGTTPIAAFLKNVTKTDPRVNATSVTFAETASGIFFSSLS